MSGQVALLAQQDRLVAAARANLIAAWFVVDASGSMAGGRWTRAQAGVRSCISQLSDMDFVGLITFSDKVNVVDANMKKDLKSAPFFRMSPGGGTALYDGVAQMVLASTQIHVKLTQEIKNMGVITYVVVLTDGEDTSSKLNLASTQKILTQVNRLNNFKIIFAGINLDYKSSQALRALGSVGDRDIEFRDLKSNDDIKDLFEHITVQFQLQRTNCLVVGDSKSQIITTSTQSYPIGPGGSLGPAIPGGGGYGGGYGGYTGASTARPAIGYSSGTTSYPENWKTGLCDCGFGMCLLGLCCPCVLFGMNADKLGDGCCGPCCFYTCCSLIGCPCCAHLPQRTKIEKRYNLRSDCNPLCATWCCTLCANCQEARELALREGDSPAYQQMS